MVKDLSWNISSVVSKSVTKPPFRFANVNKKSALSTANFVNYIFGFTIERGCNVPSPSSSIAGVCSSFFTLDAWVASSWISSWISGQKFILNFLPIIIADLYQFGGWQADSWRQNRRCQPWHRASEKGASKRPGKHPHFHPPWGSLLERGQEPLHQPCLPLLRIHCSQVIFNHSTPIYEQCSNLSAMVLALPWQRAHQDDLNNTQGS